MRNYCIFVYGTNYVEGNCVIKRYYKTIALPNPHQLITYG